MRYVLIEYETCLKMVVLNRIYFDNKKEIQDYLCIKSSTLENFLQGKILGKRKSLSKLNSIDIYRKFEYGFPSIEKTLQIGIEDLNEILILMKKNLKKI